MIPSGDQAWQHVRYDPDIAFRARARWIVEALCPGPDDTILDAGCGLGFYLSLLGTLSQSRIVGVELSRERLLAVTPGTRAARAQANLMQLPFADGTFDKVLLSEVLEHLPEEREALAELHRVLKPGGLLVVTVPHQRYPFLWDPLNCVRERLGHGHFSRRPWSGIWTDHHRLYSATGITATLRGGGFRPERPVLFTRWSMPLAHFLVYEVGQRLLSLSGSPSGQRESLWATRPPLPLRLLIRAFTFPDRWNRPTGYASGTAVSVCVRTIRD